VGKPGSGKTGVRVDFLAHRSVRLVENGLGKRENEVRFTSRGAGGAGAVSGSDSGEAAGFGLDHRLEVVAAPCALLLQIGADGLKVVVCQCFAEQGLIRRCTFDARGAEPRISGMWL